MYLSQCKVRDYAVRLCKTREYWLSVRLSECDFYEENTSALEASFGWQEA